MGVNKEWYSTTEVAELLGRSDRYVRDRVKAGEIPAQMGGGDKRVSYKISREALVGWMMAGERRTVGEVAGLMKQMDTRYLKEMEESITQELLRRADGKVEILPKCRAAHRHIVALEAKRLPGSFVWDEQAEVYEKYYNNPLLFCSTALEVAKGRVEGHLSIQITSVEFYEALCAGRVKDDYQPPWERGQTPILYIDCLMLEDPLWTPFLFKHMCGQIKEFERRERLNVEACFAVAAGSDSLALLERYGFKPVAKVEGKYPVMLNREVKKSRLGRYLQ